MALTYCQTERTCEVNEKFDRIYTIKFRVWDNNATIVYNDLQYLLAIPIGIKSHYDNLTTGGADYYARCISKKLLSCPVETQNGKDVLVTFSSAPTNSGDQSSSTPPTHTDDKALNPPTFTSYTENRPYFWKQDLSDTPKDVKTSAGEPIKTQRNVPFSGLEISFFRHDAGGDPQALKSQFQNSLNSDTFVVGPTSYQPNSLKCEAWEYTRSYDAASSGTAGGWIYALKIKLLICPADLEGDWTKLDKILDAGTMIQNATTNKLECILDATGNQINQPVPLDGSGKVLDNPDSTDFSYLEFKFHKAVTWTGQILPSTI